MNHNHTCTAYNNVFSLGVVMFAGEQLSSYVPDVGIQETMSEHDEAPLWKIKYVIL